MLNTLLTLFSTYKCSKLRCKQFNNNSLVEVQEVSMIPDEQANLLGPNGFTSGVGPANLGLSLNLNL
eukprot:518307-Hanusia_phi.AAC.1